MNVAKAAALVGVGFLTAWLILPAGPRDARTEARRHAAGQDPAAPQMWTCSMHPQIRRPGPGQCPICGMDLIPVGRIGGTLSGLRQLELSPAARELMNLEVWPVERRFATAEVRMVGKVEYDETRLRRITAWIPGRLDRLFVDFTGAQVRQGDHLVYIYSPDLYTAQQELIQALRSARERGPQTRLPAMGIDLVESAREKLRLLGLTDQQLREIEQQEQPSSHLTIYAPMGGIVIEKLKKEGDYVQTGDQIYTVADLSQVWVQLAAYESDFVWLRYGQEVSFTTEAYPGERFLGRIAFIDPILDDRTRTVQVRVNVSNPERKLKPSMFVRGVVRSEIAAAGRVMEAELAGKWICPMHPEIVKEDADRCDICGMQLVQAETLGYVSVEDVRTEPPLVIPASAVLWTGTRAIVYVEVPETDQPTYEGREIVLGPRAGDYYLVRNGLQEGELVVTRGNFKIDSALQIQAQPSMMTPKGGGGGGHQHDHGASAATPSPEEAPVQTPPEFLAQLQQVEAAHQDIAGTLEGTTRLAHVQEAFRKFGEAVNRVDPELVQGHAAMLWKEFRMLLANDAVEGQEVRDRAAAERIARQATQTIERIREQLIEPHREHVGHADHVAQRLVVPESFAAQIGDVLQSYFRLQTALADDDLPVVRQAVANLRSSTERVDDGELNEPTRQVWRRQQSGLASALGELQKQDELPGLRVAFSPLSQEMEALVHRFGAGPAGPVYRVHCPMAMQNRGAWWLQQSEEVRNPYFGASMLKCHDRLEKIASSSGQLEQRPEQPTRPHPAQPHTEEHVHE